MEKVKLLHPEGKKAIAMDKSKYDILKASFIESLTMNQPAPFKQLLAAVTTDLKTKNITIKGVIEWNLFWVTLDMEARNDLKKDSSKSPYLYSL